MIRDVTNLSGLVTAALEIDTFKVWNRPFDEFFRPFYEFVPGVLSEDHHWKAFWTKISKKKHE